MLDQKDKYIINSLEADAKTTLKKLSKELSISITSVRRRIIRLEKNGVIKGYKAIINKSLLGITTALVCIKTKDGKCLDVMRTLENYRHVKRCVPAQVDNDIIVKVEGKGLKEIQQTMSMIKKIDGVKEVDVSIIQEVDI